MGSADVSIITELKELLDTDSAVAGEAAGMAIGMVLVGTGAGNVKNTLASDGKEEITEIVSDLMNYARETQHEKIIRGISIGLALMQFQQEENSDGLIEEMRTDRDPSFGMVRNMHLLLLIVALGRTKQFVFCFIPQLVT